MNVRRAVEHDEEVELTALEHRYSGVVHQARAEWLGRRLRLTGALAVAECSRGMAGDRVRMSLDDGTVIRLWLFWPIRVGVAALGALFWHDEVGWVVDVRTAAGEPRRLYAWKVRVTFIDAAGDRAEPTGAPV